MNYDQHGVTMFRTWQIRRPLSTSTVVLAVILIVIALYQRFTGMVYLAQLNWVDWTALILLAILLLRSIQRLRA